jgi:hypothetical protein
MKKFETFVIGITIILFVIVLIGFISAIIVLPSTLTTGLKLYYKMNENDGTGSGIIIDANDQMNGTNYGADNVTGKFSRGYKFIYANQDNITSDSNTGITDADPFTISGWIKREDRLNGQLYSIFMIGKYGGNDDMSLIAFGGGNDDDLAWVTYGGGACEDTSIASGVNLIGEWHHIVVVYDGSDGALYVDGVNVYNCTATLTLVDSPLYIGSNTQSVQALNGTVDEVGLWNRPLTTDEILELYNYSYAIITVSVLSPISTNYLSGDIYFNATANEVIDTWIVNYNGTNVTMSDINTTLNVEVGTHDLIVYASDSEGNYGINNSISFNVYDDEPIEISQTYNTSAYETDSQTFKVNYVYDSSAWDSTSATFNYDGTSYTATKQGTGDNINFTKTIDVSEVDSASNKSFYWNIALSNSTGTYYYN